MTVGSFDAVAQISNRRPTIISDPRQNVPAGLSFNPAAFVAPPDGQLGNAGRNTLRGDRFYNTDISLIRQFPLPVLGDAGSLSFRAEFFNAFNHSNFNLPVSSLSSGAFGRYVNNATAPRIVQFALKVTF